MPPGRRAIGRAASTGAAGLPPYSSDFLTNYEFGWKTTTEDNRLRFNGAIFWEEWEDFQFSFPGANGLTQIQNAGSATIKGIESDIGWAVSDRLHAHRRRRRI